MGVHGHRDRCPGAGSHRDRARLLEPRALDAHGGADRRTLRTQVACQLVGARAERAVDRRTKFKA